VASRDVQIVERPDFADTISLANIDVDASDMILAFFKQHALVRLN
jgi:hypothetical protein